jgi:uncharacterized protein DUF3617
MTRARSIALLSFALSIAGGTAGAADHLDVKLGLWESTTTSESSGLPPLANSGLTPEQKARLEEMMKKRQAQGPRTHVTKSCLTQEKLEREPFANAGEKGQSCTTKMLSQTRTHWQGTTVCTGNGQKREFAMNLTAVSREQVKGTIQATMSDSGHTMKVHNTIAAKWLGSDCGKVK